MLIQDFVEVDVPFEQVIDLLDQEPGEMGVWAAAAYRRGERLAVGPGPAMSTTVEMRIGPTLRGMETATIPIEWEASNAAAFFPHMMAELVVAPLPTGGSQVRFRGSYDAPLDGFGRVLDRLALHRIAESTVRSFLQRLAEAVRSDMTVGRFVAEEG
jgi:hypothetical protein